MYGTYLGRIERPTPNPVYAKQLKTVCNTLSSTQNSSSISTETENFCESTSNTSIVAARTDAVESGSDTQLRMLRMRKGASNSSSQNFGAPSPTGNIPSTSAKTIINSLTAIFGGKTTEPKTEPKNKKTK